MSSNSVGERYSRPNPRFAWPPGAEPPPAPQVAYRVRDIRTTDLAEGGPQPRGSRSTGRRADAYGGPAAACSVDRCGPWNSCERQAELGSVERPAPGPVPPDASGWAPAGSTRRSTIGRRQPVHRPGTSIRNAGSVCGASGRPRGRGRGFAASTAWPHDWLRLVRCVDQTPTKPSALRPPVFPSYTPAKHAMSMGQTTSRLQPADQPGRRRAHAERRAKQRPKRGVPSGLWLRCDDCGENDLPQGSRAADERLPGLRPAHVPQREGPRPFRAGRRAPSRSGTPTCSTGRPSRFRRQEALLGAGCR